MPASRFVDSTETRELLHLVRGIASDRLVPRAVEDEATGTFPRDLFSLLGETYVQVLEEIGAAWAAVGVGVSVHALSCFPLAEFGTREQRNRWLPRMVSGEVVGAYCLSEANAGSDPSAMRARAVRDSEGYVLSGAKAWTTHGGHADYYTVLARTSDDRQGISCFLVRADAPGIHVDPPERKMGLTSSPTATVRFDGVRVAEERRIGDEGQGLRIALAALDAGRLGIAAVAVGLAQGALDLAVGYAQQRETFGRRIIDHQGLGFVLADMEASVQTSRAMLLRAAWLKDQGASYAREASIAKLVATDSAMKVTTDAVQVLGGYGYTKDFAAERYMREAKITQIFEGTNQIQRLVISRSLDRDPAGRIRTVAELEQG